MNNTLVWTFAERCASARAVEDVRKLFLREVDALGFPYVACASHVDPLRPPPEAVTMLHYPRAWVEHFSVQNLANRDPVFMTAKRQLLPFQWSDRAFRKSLTLDQLTILNEAAEAGLRDGFTIPLHSLSSARCANLAWRPACRRWCGPWRREKSSCTTWRSEALQRRRHVSQLI